jgi:hypothetical protein
VVPGDQEVGEVALVAGLDRGDELFGRLPGLLRGMMGVPWVSSAQTKRAVRPCMRWARTQMSPWM